MTKKLYAERNPTKQGQHYMNHLMAMTAEGLHSKSAIAEELAHRDIVIKEMQKTIDMAYKFYSDVMPQIGGLCIQDYDNLNQLGILLDRLKTNKDSNN